MACRCSDAGKTCNCSSVTGTYSPALNDEIGMASFDEVLPLRAMPVK